MKTAARDLFDLDHLAVEQGSQLAIMAEVNRAAGMRYADALLSELEGLLAACTKGDVAASPVAAFEHIHALKNAVIPTGCEQILSACTDLHIRAAWSREQVEFKADFTAIAQATQDLIRAFRRALDGGITR